MTLQRSSLVPSLFVFNLSPASSPVNKTTSQPAALLHIHTYTLQHNEIQEIKNKFKLYSESQSCFGLVSTNSLGLAVLIHHAFPSSLTCIIHSVVQWSYTFSWFPIVSLWWELDSQRAILDTCKFKGPLKEIKNYVQYLSLNFFNKQMISSKHGVFHFTATKYVHTPKEVFSLCVLCIWTVSLSTYHCTHHDLFQCFDIRTFF